jgi:hypothetical protein
VVIEDLIKTLAVISIEKLHIGSKESLFLIADTIVVHVNSLLVPVSALRLLLNSPIPFLVQHETVEFVALSVVQRN